jgi:P63C domain
MTDELFTLTSEAAKELSQLGAAKGGDARAQKLSPERRSEIARQAVEARWAKAGKEPVPVATHGSLDRPLRIANIELQAYVLSDGTRVLSQAGFLEAMGRHRKANVKRKWTQERIPTILHGKAINEFISKEILEKSRPIKFRTPHGVIASGYRADLLPDVCEIYLKARDAGKLPSNQIHIAKQAEILIRGLANVGIIALVDEATGYQDDRARDALAKILEAFVAKELRKWVRTFPGEFYKEMFRLRRLPYNGTVRRPQYLGHLTNDLVYARLAPGVLDELKRVTPRDDKGRLKHHLHRRLTEELGHPKLLQHLAALTALMRGCDTWDQFKKLVEKALPKQVSLPLFDGPRQTESEA